jgi:hypothetical protein
LASDDDIWRAAVKQIAFKPKNIRTTFEKILEVVFGPQYSRVGTLVEDAEVGDTSIVLNDASSLVQVGTITLDPGLPSEETVQFCFRDLVTNTVHLRSPLTQAHTAKYEDANSYLVADIAIGATAIPLFDSSFLPTANYPYPILLGRGTEQEEVVLVSNNNTTTNVLTTSATVFAHEGPTSKFLRRVLNESAVTGQIFLQMDIGDTRDFPADGLLVVDQTGGGEELVEYRTNAVDDNSFILKTPLVNNQAAGVSVELLNRGANVDILDVWQQGAYWQIYITDPYCVQIYIMQDVAGLRDIDASWIHGPADPAPPSTTLAVAASIGDTELELVSAAGFPDEAETILLSGTETAFYTLRDEDALPNPKLILSQPLTAAHLLGATVAVVEYSYPGTNLKDGNFRDLFGDIVFGRFPGPYLYDATQRAPSLTRTTLVTPIPGPTRLAVDQLPARSCLEVLDAAEYTVVPTPFSVRVARETGFQEDLEVVDVTLMAGLSTTVVAGAAGNAFLDVVDSTGFPESSDGVTVAGYRIIVDPGGLNEELIVSQNGTTLANRFLLTDPLGVTFAGGEAVLLLQDVLTVDPTTVAHVGQDLTVSEVGQSVEILLDEIDVASGVGFPEPGGQFWINFGKERTNARAIFQSITAATIWAFDDTDDFPTADFPHRAVLGEGTANEEVVSILANNTALDELTFAAAPANPHVAGASTIRFISGDPQVVTYVDRDINTLEFAGPTVFTTKHTIGENVIYSPDDSIPPTDGTGYPLLMPPDPYALLQFLIDLVRAAGIQVKFITDR